MAITISLARRPAVRTTPHTPATLGPAPLVGVGYFGIIAAAILVGGMMIARSHWLVWAAAGGLAASDPAAGRSGGSVT